jgi:hypothetical protein
MPLTPLVQRCHHLLPGFYVSSSFCAFCSSCLACLCAHLNGRELPWGAVGAIPVPLVLQPVRLRSASVLNPNGCRAVATLDSDSQFFFAFVAHPTVLLLYLLTPMALITPLTVEAMQVTVAVFACRGAGTFFTCLLSFFNDFGLLLFVHRLPHIMNFLDGES